MFIKLMLNPNSAAILLPCKFQGEFKLRIAGDTAHFFEKLIPIYEISQSYSE